MIMREYCYKILTLVMVATMSIPSYAQNTVTEHDSTTSLTKKHSEMIMAIPDKDNVKVIKRYNRYSHHPLSISNSPYSSVGYTAVFGVRENSIMSTDDVEVNFVKKWVPDPIYNDMDNRMYFVEIHNKTDQTIYIDKASCYRIYNKGAKHCYFTPNKNNKNLAERIMAIPPHAKKNLCEYDAVLTNSKSGNFQELKIKDYPEDFHWDSRSAGIYKGFLQKFEVRTYSEDNSPYYRTYIITYSKDKDFSTYTLLPINFYMRQLIGNYYPELYQENDIFEQVKELVTEKVIKAVIPADLMDENTRIFINPTGRFVVGGPQGDSGLTGRKIIVDTYGGFARHGGGCFSGKDPTKVDRSACYMMRYVAKNIVAAGLASECEVQVAYAIGVAKPVSVMVDTFGTGKIEDEKLTEIVNKVFDLRPAAIIRDLDLRRPIYSQTASYGHFGRTDVELPWEKTDKAEELKQLAGI